MRGAPEQPFDGGRPGTYLTKGGERRPAYLVGNGRVCYWKDKAGRWLVGKVDRFTPTR